MQLVSSIIINKNILQFFTGWWLVIDAHAKFPGDMSGAYHVCGIFGTISLFMCVKFNL